MKRIHEVTLELVRPGPPHNQLLSPLTPYMALCGDGSPITFHIDWCAHAAGLSLAGFGCVLGHHLWTLWRLRPDEAASPS